METKAPSYMWRFFREFVSPHRLALGLLLGNILIRAGLELWWPYAAKGMWDDVLTPLLKTSGPVAPAADWHLFWWFIGIGAGVLFFNSLLGFYFNRLLNRLLTVITQRARTRLASHLLKLHAQFYDSNQAGRLLTTAIEDPQSITQQLTAEMVRAAASAFVVLGGYFILIHYSLTLTLAITPVFFIMVLAFFILKPYLQQASYKVRENWGIMTGMVAEKLAAVRVVRSFAAEEIESKRFRDNIFHHANLNLKSNYYSVLYGFLNGLSIHLGYLIVYGVGGWLFFHGQITMGTIVAFLGYFQSLYPRVLQLCNLPQLITSSSGSLTKVFNLLDEPVAIASKPGAHVFEGDIKDIVFDGVSFRFRPNLPWALKSVSLHVKAGESLGIIGPSGSGKSTMMALLMRFYEPTEGRILVNGRDLKDWDLHSLRRVFGLVPQEVILFSGPIRDNLLYSREAEDVRVWETLEQAEAADFVKKLEEGLDSHLGEKGVSLSGGQKQRLSIARALLTQPQVLVLDNCTSALDAETEQRLQATLRRIQERRTAFEISHRISSVSHCERILVMDAGQIIEQGSFEELLKKDGYFASIHRQQSSAGLTRE